MLLDDEGHPFEEDMLIIRALCAVSAAVSTIGDKDSSSKTIVRRAKEMEDYILSGSTKHKKGNVD